MTPEAVLIESIFRASRGEDSDILRVEQCKKLRRSIRVYLFAYLDVEEKDEEGVFVERSH